jgi:glutamine amidotransferase
MKPKAVVGIVDYGLGNHASVSNALKVLGYQVIISQDHESLRDTSMIVLPGVGAFAEAMTGLKERALDRFIYSQVDRKPIVGICLGMQLLADISFENGGNTGLGLIPGSVEKIGSNIWHIGWNELELKIDDPLFNGIDGENVYFNHSYQYKLSGEYIIANTRLSSEYPLIPSIIRKNKIIGMQFHPEKSQISGMRLLKKLLDGLCSD